MMEFFLSKLWMFIAGVAVIGLTVSAFGGLNDDLSEDELMDMLAGTRDALAEMDDCPAGTTVSLSPGIPSGAVLRVGNGSLWLERDGADLMLACPASVTTLQDGTEVRYIEVRPDDVLVVKRCPMEGRVVTVVQLEKAAASSSTALTNLLASASLLYR